MLSYVSLQGRISKNSPLHKRRPLLGVTAHVMRATVSPGGTAFDGRTMWQAGDQTSLEVRKRSEEVFG